VAFERPRDEVLVLERGWSRGFGNTARIYRVSLADPTTSCLAAPELAAEAPVLEKRLLVDMAKHSGLPWDCVLSGELIHKYKPDPDVYQMAARLLGAGNDETMLVAAHPDDLLGAQRAGLKTAYVPRPLEHGPKPLVPPPPGAKFDYTAADFLDLARQLGA